MAMQLELWPEARRPLQPIDVEYLACELRKYYSYLLGTKDLRRTTPGERAAHGRRRRRGGSGGGGRRRANLRHRPVFGKSTLCSRSARRGMRPKPRSRRLSSTRHRRPPADQIRGDEIAWQTSNLKANFARIERLRAAGTPTFVDTSFIETVVFAERCGIALGAGIEACSRRAVPRGLPPRAALVRGRRCA